MFNIRSFSAAAALSFAMSCAITGLHAQDANGNSSCAGLPGHSVLATALATALANENSGLNHQMWATIVDRDGVVCAVAFSGVNRGAQWPGSRVISAQKANTANAFSLDSSSHTNGKGQTNGLALSTANLFTAVQPGGSLFGLQESNPVDTRVAYKGPSSNYGQANDPMVGNKIGGVNVFGGGLGLYSSGKVLVGGLGVSGATSCTDHDIAWRIRHALGWITWRGSEAYLATRRGRTISSTISSPIPMARAARDRVRQAPAAWARASSGFGHPKCLNVAPPNTLPAVQ